MHEDSESIFRMAYARVTTLRYRVAQLGELFISNSETNSPNNEDLR